MAPALKFTAETRATIVETLRSGATVTAAAGRARVSARTVNKWRERGRTELGAIEDGATPSPSEEPFADFELDAAQALGEIEYELLRKVMTEKSWQRFMTVLERRFGYVAVHREQYEHVGSDGPDPEKAFGSADPLEWFRQVHNLGDGPGQPQPG
jgi:transposase-like protein